MRFHWKMKYFFCSLPVGGTKRKKKRMEKRKTCRRGSWVGYCPFPSFGRDIAFCIATGKGAGVRYDRAGAQQRAHDTTQQRCDMASYARNIAGLRVGRAVACSPGAKPQGSVVIQIFVSQLGTTTLCATRRSASAA